MSGYHQKKHKYTSKQHKAAVELAKNKRELAKVLKKEGVQAEDIFNQPNKRVHVENETTITPEQPAIHDEATKRLKLAARKKRAKLLNKRTKKGQPIMKHVIADLVSKLD